MNRSDRRPSPAHRFSAHLREEGVHARQWVAEADSFIDAAIRFAESKDIVDGQISIVVTDLENGKDRCFLVNLGTGDVQGC